MGSQKWCPLHTSYFLSVCNLTPHQLKVFRQQFWNVETVDAQDCCFLLKDVKAYSNWQRWCLMQRTVHTSPPQTWIQRSAIKYSGGSLLLCQNQSHRFGFHSWLIHPLLWLGTSLTCGSHIILISVIIQMYSQTESRNASQTHSVPFSAGSYRNSLV